MTSDFLVWHQGPDDVHECETWHEAVELANKLNVEYERWIGDETGSHRGLVTRSWAVPYGREDYLADYSDAWDRGYTVGYALNGRRDANPYRKAVES